MDNCILGGMRVDGVLEFFVLGASDLGADRSETHTVIESIFKESDFDRILVDDSLWWCLGLVWISCC